MSVHFGYPSFSAVVVAPRCFTRAPLGPQTLSVMARGPVKKKIVKRKRARGATRSTATRVQAQGTGKAVVKAFGARTSSSPQGLPVRCWDAFHTSHAALPRAVGPYTVVRTTGLITTSSRFNIVCTTQEVNTAAGRAFWTNRVLMSEEGPGAIGSTQSTGFVSIGSPLGRSGLDSTGTVCPAAISVQVMGNQSLQTAAGTLAAAVIPARMDLQDDTRTWGAIETDFVSYFRPRLLSAGKLVLRGVQMDSFPLSMSAVSEFLPFSDRGNVGPVNWDAAARTAPVGWAPMVIYNPNNDVLNLLVTIEWRVRFDVGHPAVASHTHHGVSTDSAWNRHIKRAADALPGVVDIVEKVASAGMALRNISSAMA